MTSRACWRAGGLVGTFFAPAPLTTRRAITHAVGQMWPCHSAQRCTTPISRCLPRRSVIRRCVDKPRLLACRWASGHIFYPCTPHHSPSHHARCRSDVAMSFSTTVHVTHIKVPATPLGDPMVRWLVACWRASMLVSSIPVLIGDHLKNVIKESKHRLSA